MVTRADRAREVKRLRESYGFTYAEIARVMGISRSYANMLVTDPDGAKQLARRERYRGTCLDCGAKTTGSEGRAKAPTRCLACSLKKQAEETTIWTDEAIVAAIQHFAQENGRPPLSSEWLRADRNKPGGYRYPATSNILLRMGSWANAVEAAGFPRPRQGHNPLGRKTWAFNPRQPHYVDVDELVQELRRRSKDGVAPRMRDDNNKLWSAFRRRGVTWAEACERAGVKPFGHTRAKPQPPTVGPEFFQQKNGAVDVAEQPSLLRRLGSLLRRSR